MFTLNQIRRIVSEKPYSVTGQIEVIEATNFSYHNRYNTPVI